MQAHDSLPRSVIVLPNGVTESGHLDCLNGLFAWHDLNWPSASGFMGVSWTSCDRMYRTRTLFRKGTHGHILVLG